MSNELRVLGYKNVIPAQAGIQNFFLFYCRSGSERREKPDTSSFLSSRVPTFHVGAWRSNFLRLLLRVTIYCDRNSWTAAILAFPLNLSSRASIWTRGDLCPSNSANLNFYHSRPLTCHYRAGGNPYSYLFNCRSGSERREKPDTSFIIARSVDTSSFLSSRVPTSYGGTWRSNFLRLLLRVTIYCDRLSLFCHSRAGAC